MFHMWVIWLQEHITGGMGIRPAINPLFVEAFNWMTLKYSLQPTF